MKPRRIILIRHGESEGNLDHSLYKTTLDYALKLTQRGISQAEKLARKSNHSSVMNRFMNIFPRFLEPVKPLNVFAHPPAAT
jgi:broad specificity phosphatase PhoE